MEGRYVAFTKHTVKMVFSTFFHVLVINPLECINTSQFETARKRFAD